MQSRLSRGRLQIFAVGIIDIKWILCTVGCESVGLADGRNTVQGSGGTGGCGNDYTEYTGASLLAGWATSVDTRVLYRVL